MACPALLALVEGLAPQLRTADYRTARDRIEAELDNFRAAMDWSLPAEGGDDQGDVRIGFRLCQELTWYWYAFGYPEEVAAGSSGQQSESKERSRKRSTYSMALV
jgi:hypothetical protein